MKIFLHITFLWLVGTSAFAGSLPIPPSTLLKDLKPEETLVLVKKDVQTDQPFSDSANNKMIGGNRPLAKGELFNLLAVTFNEAYVTIDFDIPKSSNHGIAYFGKYGGPLPRTVADIDSRSNNFIQLVQLDLTTYNPFPGLDKDVVVDLVMSKITNALAAKQYRQSLKDFYFLEKLGIDLPETFYFYYADTLEKAGETDQARDRATAYLAKFGKKGKYYSRFVELMGRL